MKQEMRSLNIVIEGSPDRGLWKVSDTPRKKWMKAGTENQSIVTEDGQGQCLWKLSTIEEAGHPPVNLNTEGALGQILLKGSITPIIE